MFAGLPSACLQILKTVHVLLTLRTILWYDMVQLYSCLHNLAAPSQLTLLLQSSWVCLRGNAEQELLRIASVKCMLPLGVPCVSIAEVGFE